MEKHARSIMLRACFLGVSVRRVFNLFYRPFGATIIGSSGSATIGPPV